MSKGEFVFDRGIAIYRVEVDGGYGVNSVEFRFDLLRNDRRTAEMSAEVTTIAGSNGTAERLHRARVNLGSTRSRNEFTKHVNDRLELPDWPGLLEEASWEVIDAYREGRSAILLRDVEEPVAAGMALPPLLAAADPTILFGDGGTAKSYLGLALALALHTNQPIGDLQPAREMRIAYLDWEWNEWPHHRRLRALCGSATLPDLVYVPCQPEGPLSGQVDRLRRIFNQHRIEYAILDSVALACDGPPEEAQSALGFFQALARLEVGNLLIAHVNREGDTTKPFGSAFWHNSARATWYVKRVQEVGGQSLDVGLFNQKVNDGPAPAPLGFRFDFGDEPGRITSGDRTQISSIAIASVPDLATQLPLKGRIAEALKDGPKSYVELASLLEVETNTVIKTVGRYEGRLFTKVTDAADRVNKVALQEVTH